MKRKNKLLSNKLFAVVLIAVILVTAGAVLYKTYNKIHLSKNPVKPVLIRRTKSKGIIKVATTAKKIDPKTQNIILAARVFTPVDKTIYLVLDLDNPPVGTPIDIIKTRNGKYVNHEEVIINNSKTNKLVFTWRASLIGSFTEGNYRVKTYEKGVLSKRVDYSIQKDNVFVPEIEEIVQQSDPDYLLSAELPLNSN